MKLLSQTTFSASLLISAMFAIQGCSSLPDKTDLACDLPTSQNIDAQFAAVDQRLMSPSCQLQHDAYLAALIASARRSPGPDNEARFAELFRSSIDRGVISKGRGQELFSRYFDSEYYVVKYDARNVCSSLRSKASLYDQMGEELAQKRTGLLEILGDEPRFREAQHFYRDLRTVFDATESACATSL